MLEIGTLEYKLYDTYCYYLRLRRKKDLIQAKRNRQEAFDIKLIEKQLDEEFIEYTEKLKKKISDINEALERSNSEKISEEESKELKNSYRKLVKQLHPDLNPSQKKLQKNSFIRQLRPIKMEIWQP